MLKFALKNSEAAVDVYALTEDEAELAEVKARGGRILSVKYASPAVDKELGDFVLRSAAFVLRDKFPIVSADFFDERLLALGFTRCEGGMSAESIKIRFDNCRRQ